MTRKLITTGIFAAVSLSAIVAVGCSTTNGNAPYSLTGQSQAQIDEKHAKWVEDQRFTDEKGRYHPELAASNRPIH